MSFLFGNVTTYEVDKPLFRKLGFKEFNIGNSDKTLIGTHDVEDFIVRVSVECYPAQFWTFEIEEKETGNVIDLSTGSGYMSEYWNTVELIIGGMLDIKLK